MVQTEHELSFRKQNDLKVIIHQPWNATHRLKLIYPHTKYQKLILKDEKLQAQTQ